VYQWISGEEWNKFEIARFEEVICRLRFDLNKNVLSVITNDGVCSLFKESTQFKWELVCLTNTEGTIENINEN
jgi:hypothetical protein